MRVLLAIAAIVGATCVAVQAQTPAPVCTDSIRANNCTLPTCRCSGTDIPGALLPANTPQLVFLTFDDAITIDNYAFYKQLFNPSRKNPNGHPITGTFYIAHEYTNYSMVHDLWRDGHEIALHSMSHSPYTSYWRDLNESMWKQEVVDQRAQMAAFARMTANEIKGFRAPFLQTRGDVMYDVLSKNGFQYECSRPTLALRKPGLWPYTNDYKSEQDCQIDPCPVNSYPGFWTVPMIDLIGDDGEGCAMVDTCTPVPDKQASTYDLLVRNFEDHRGTGGNKAPFGLYAHHAWVNGSANGEDLEAVLERRKGYEQFIDYVLTLGDTYVVSVTRGVEWVKTPKNINDTLAFDAFKVVTKNDGCPRPFNCFYRADQTPFPTERYMYSCVTCPQVYPWLGNPLGRG